MIRRIEPACGPAASEAAAKHGLRAPKGRVQIVAYVNRAHGIREVGVIKNIECFGAKLKSQPVFQAKVAAECEIQLVDGEPSQKISRKIALSIFDGSQKWTNLRSRVAGNRYRLIVESPSTGSFRVFEVERYSFDKIRPKAERAKPDVA